jgi:hypothetical protein
MAYVLCGAGFNLRAAMAYETAPGAKAVLLAKLVSAQFMQQLAPVSKEH